MNHKPMTAKLGTAILSILFLVFSGLGYVAIRSQYESDIYRDRLLQLGEEYSELAHRYQEAVRKSAVTELRVHNNKLSVLIRTMEGVIEEIPTPFDPRGEIYVDYVVLDDRLWIRRVFDEHTPPSRALVVDPTHARLDWTLRGEHEHGKAVYRQLQEGRWIVTTTGAGALALTRVSSDARIELAAPPTIRDYEELESDTQRPRDKIHPLEIVKRAMGR